MQIETVLPRFGLSEFRPGQREVIEAVLAGRPTIAVMPTGAGKSLCYQLPGGRRCGGLTVVVSPLISLMKDQVDALRGARRAGGASSTARSADGARRERAARGGRAASCALLYVAPERFRAPRLRRRRSRERAGARWSPSTRRTASPSGATTSGPTTARLGEVLRAARRRRGWWRSPRPRRPTVRAATSASSSA